MTSTTPMATRWFGLLAACSLAACAADAGSSDTTGTEAPEQNAHQGETVFNMSSVADFALTLDPAAVATMNAEMAVVDAHRDLEHL